MNLCSNLFLLKLLRLLYTAINIIHYVVPIFLIIMLFIDVYNDMLIGEGKRIKEISVKRILAALIVFLVPTFVNLLFNVFALSGNSVDTPYCLSNLDNINHYEELAEKQREVERLIKLEQEKYQRELNKQAQEVYKKSQNTSLDNPIARHMGQTYNLTNSELNGLCGVARNEQGSILGAKAEASLMANLYELLSEDNRFYGKGLYNYVLNSGWFSNASKHMESGCSPEYINAVYDVLVNGNRTLPLYVNEHDCFNCIAAHACGEVSRGDICSIKTNGVNYTSISEITNRSNYVANETKVYTYYYDGGYWVFYSFPAPNSVPFGYTESAKRKVTSMMK